MKKTFLVSLALVLLLVCNAEAFVGQNRWGTGAGISGGGTVTGDVTFADDVSSCWGAPDICISWISASNYLQMDDGTNPFWRVADDGTVATHTFFDTIALSDGTDTHEMKAVQEPGLGGRWSFGLDETARTLWIGDIGDIDTDHGLSAFSNPTIAIFDDDASNRGLIYVSGTDFSIDHSDAGTSDINLIAGRSLEAVLARDSASGDFFKVRSNANTELTDTDGEQSWLYIEAKLNAANTEEFNSLQIKTTEILIGSGGHNLIKAGTSGDDDMFRLTNLGDVVTQRFHFQDEFDDEVNGVQVDSGLNADRHVVAGTNYAAANATFVTEDGGAIKLLNAAADNDSVTYLDNPFYNTDNNPVIECRIKLDTKETAGFYCGLADASMANLSALDQNCILVGIDSDNGHGYGATAIVIASKDDVGAVIYDDTGLTYTSGQWLRIRIDLGDVEQPIIRVDDTVVASGSVTGTVKASTTMGHYMMVQNQAGGAIQRFITAAKIEGWQDQP